MPIHPPHAIAAAVLVVCFAAPRLAEAGRVELDVFLADEQTPILSQQEWLQRLAEVGVTSLRIHARGPQDNVGVEVRGTTANPLYVVKGGLTGNELVLPGGRFRPAQARAVAKYLEELAEKGPPEPSGKKSAFGLSAEQFRQLQQALSRPAGFSTRGQPWIDVARKLAGQVNATLPPGEAAAMAEEQVGEELQDLALGTALAHVLRPAGLCLVPTAGGQGFAIRSSKTVEQPWPVGWEPDKPLPQVLPALYESFNANIENVPISRVLTAMGPRLKVPILVDQNALARHGVDPQKAAVNAPKSKTTHTLLLRKVLSQAKLKYEVRVDEAGKPFLWVTTVKSL